MTLTENQPLAPLTTLGVGGPARYFCAATDETELRAALAWAREKQLPTFLLGGGSNLVVSDAGFAGLVIPVRIEGITVESGNQITAGAGGNWDGFVRFCVENHMQGIECLAGIPGSVGATPVQNVGAYGQEVAETIQSVRVLDLGTDTIHDIPNSECGFAYRRSRFNAEESGRWVILSVTFALKPEGKPNLRYAELQKYFEGRQPALSEVYEAVREIRSRKGMVVRADDPDSRSAGSFFKNPVVSTSDFDEHILPLAAGATVPHWSQPDGRVKLSAAWLIEKAGLRRGEVLGNASLSHKHVLALVNQGGATAAEIVALARHIQARVQEASGVILAPEPVFVGFNADETLPVGATRYPSD